MLYVKLHISQLAPQMHEIRLYFFIFWLKNENMHLHTDASAVFLKRHACAIVLRLFKNFFYFTVFPANQTVSLTATESDKSTHEVLL